MHLEKKQNTPGAEGGRVASLQMPQRPNPVIGEKLDVPFKIIWSLALYKSICDEVAIFVRSPYLFVIQSIEVNYHSKISWALLLKINW